MSKVAAIIGRILLGFIFILSGITKLIDVAAAQAMMTGVGLPAGFAIPVGVFELVAGVSLAIGFMVRLFALLLFVFVAATILFFHNQFTDPVQGIAALKNVAIMGGLLLAFAHSQMWSHYYSITRERRGELAAHQAERRAHEAELRAARAEGLAEGRGTAAVHGGDYDGDGVADTHTHRRRGRWFDW